jgi:hypothetical protein
LPRSPMVITAPPATTTSRLNALGDDHPEMGA